MEKLSHNGIVVIDMSIPIGIVSDCDLGWRCPKLRIEVFSSLAVLLRIACILYASGGDYMNVVIRKWEINDYEDIACLFSQVHRLHQENRPDIYVKTDNPFSKEDFTQVIDNRNSIALLAKVSGKIIGFSLVTLNPPSKNPLLLPRKVAYMEDLAIHEKFRKRGIGKMLFDAVREEARNLGYHKLELMVWKFNEPAIEFYGKLGMAERSIIMEIN